MTFLLSAIMNLDSSQVEMEKLKAIYDNVSNNVMMYSILDVTL